jgi:WD40 repeat protein
LNTSAFFADGTRLLAGSQGTEAIKIWDTRTYHKVLTLDGDGTPFSTLMPTYWNYSTQLGTVRLTK